MTLRILCSLVLVGFAVIHGLFPSALALDWPSVALILLALSILFAPQISTILPFVRRLKLGQAEIELGEKASELFHAVEESEAAAPPRLRDSGDKDAFSSARFLDTTVENQILDLAAKDKEAALVRLAIEIEKELYTLRGTMGLKDRGKARTWRDSVGELKNRGLLTSSIEEAVLSFWQVRNRIVHAESGLSDTVLNSTLDSGLRILRLLKSIPRQIYRVHRSDVPLYTDPGGIHLMEDLTGVILEEIAPDGAATYRIFPAGRQFRQGEAVGWDWDMSRVYGKTFYRDTETDEIRPAWSQAAAFVGRPLPSRGNV